MTGSSRGLLLRGGRVVDPGSGLDATAHLRVRDGRVAEVGPDLPEDGDGVLDVTGLVVGPGFVDLHSHVHSVAGHRLQALDGVTTALDLEAGLMPVARAYADAAAEGRPLNYGFSASWGGARGQVLLGREPEPTMAWSLSLLGEPGWQRDSTPAELAAWVGLLERELADGALGIGVLQGYAPQTDPAEFLAVAALAARAGVPTFTHVRDLVERSEVPVDGPSEVAVAAAETGAAMHHCHLNSTSQRQIDRVLRTLGDAQADGARVTTEFYPYGSGSTGLGAAFLEPERLAAWGLSPRSVVVLGTGERVADEARLRQLRAESPGELCLLEFLDETDPEQEALLRRSMTFPDSVVASDAVPLQWPDGSHDSDAWPLPPGAVTHPRTAGTFAKALRLMVRESGAWTWSEAFRRCSLLPARLLDGASSDAVRKGHLAPGADADVVVLDPDRVAEQSSYADPVRPSLGVRHLLVGGEAVVRDGALVVDARPGRAVRG